MDFKFITYDRNTDAVPAIVNGQSILEMDGSRPVGLWLDQFDRRFPATIAGGKVQPFFAGHEVSANKLILGGDSIGNSPPSEAKNGQLFFQYAPNSQATDSSVFIFDLTDGDDTGTTKTDFSEILAAYVANKLIIGKYYGDTMICQNVGSNGALFCAAGRDGVQTIYLESDGHWTEQRIDYVWPASEGYSFPGWKNTTVRGLSRRHTPNAEFYDEIQSGSFTDMFLGDTVAFTGEGIVGDFYIAGFNLYPSIFASRGHHLVLVSRWSQSCGCMRSDHAAYLGYANSEYHQPMKEAILNSLRNGGAEVVEFETQFVDSAPDGVPTSTIKMQASVELLSETQLFGRKIVSPDPVSPAGRETFDYCQLPLFKYEPRLILPRYSDQPYWLRDVASDTEFVSIGHDGIPVATDAAEELDYRVVMIIHGYQE